jgi:SAM-dependent methyltransferase
MDEPEFDRYASDYDRVLREAIPDGFDEDGYFAQYKVALVHRRLRDAPPVRVLDFGCGAGRSLTYLEQYLPGAELWGFDVSTASLEIAARRVPRARLVSEWEALPRAGFDAIFTANVFHHIPVDERLAALRRCRGALAPGGSLFLFEHNPYNPLTRHVFERCPFDVDAKMLTLSQALALSRNAGFGTVSHAYTLFFPKPLKALRRLEPLLARLPLGAQYYVQMAD